MHSIIIKQRVYDNIDLFINSYRNMYLNIYDDTWIEDENLIRNNYVQTSKKLKFLIFQKLEKCFMSELILWKRIWDDGSTSVSLVIWNYRVFIDYLEDLTEKIRYIENIEFYKK